VISAEVNAISVFKIFPGVLIYSEVEKNYLVLVQVFSPEIIILIVI